MSKSLAFYPMPSSSQGPASKPLPDRGLSMIGAHRWHAGTLPDILYGVGSPTFSTKPAEWNPFNPNLDLSQVRAVSKSLEADHLMMIHGPPGWQPVLSAGNGTEGRIVVSAVGVGGRGGGGGRWVRQTS